MTDRWDLMPGQGELAKVKGRFCRMRDMVLKYKIAVLSMYMTPGRKAN